MGVCNCLNKRNPEEGSLLIDHFEKIACTVKCNNKHYGIGFLCNIKNPNNLETLSALFITNQNLGKTDIKLNTKIEIYQIYKKIYYYIVIDNIRKTYIDEENNITIIEIKQEDKINIAELLDIEVNMPEEDIIKTLPQKSILLLNYNNGIDKRIKIYESQIKNIEEKNKMNFYYLSKDQNPLSGCPLILSSQKNKTTIIGIHKEIKENKLYMGIFIKNLCSSDSYLQTDIKQISSQYLTLSFSFISSAKRDIFAK